MMFEQFWESVHDEIIEIDDVPHPVEGWMRDLLHRAYEAGAEEMKNAYWT